MYLVILIISKVDHNLMVGLFLMALVNIHFL